MNIDAAIVDPKTYADDATLRAVFARVRQQDPVHWTVAEHYRPFWTVSKHADIMEIERQPQLFLNAPRTTLFTIDDERRTFEQTGGGTTLIRTLVHIDDPEHRALRSVTQSWFLPKNLHGLEQGLAALATELVDKMAAMGGQCDFVKDVSVWYPLRVIMLILGIPQSDEVKMLRLTQQIFGSTDADMQREADSTDLAPVVNELFAYFSAIAANRRANPTLDVASLIANAMIDGKPIGDMELLSYYTIIITAGHDTTSSSMAGGLLALIQNPAELNKLRENPELLTSAVDEMIRWTTPVRHFFRSATQDYVLRGKKIRAGDALMMCYPSANQDEDVFEQPEVFKVDRPTGKHIAFGYGPHLCIGQHLARMELRALYKELLARVEHIELAGQPKGVEATFVSGLKSLPIRYRMSA